MHYSSSGALHFGTHGSFAGDTLTQAPAGGAIHKAGALVPRESVAPSLIDSIKNIASDIGSAVVPGDLPFVNVIHICAKTGEGLDLLADLVDEMFAGSAPCDGSILSNPRQYDAIRRAYEAMLNALQGLTLGLTPDAVLTDVETAMEAMGEVTGATVREDITARIFERFCVGK